MDMSIDAGIVESVLAGSQSTAEHELDTILDKAEKLERLSLDDVAALLTTDSSSHVERMFRVAGKIKEEIYGERVVMFAPLYVSDHCVNRCR